MKKGYLLVFRKSKGDVYLKSGTLYDTVVHRGGVSKVYIAVVY